MNIMERYWNQLKAAWSGLSSAHRLMLTVVAVVVLGTTGVLVAISASTDYEVLVSGVPPEEAGAIVAQLETANIPYRLENGGTAILVAKDRHAKARVQLAAQGSLSRGGKGFELFDDASFTTTPFVQNVNYTRALQAELARSIMNLEPVASARVIIARSEPSPFIREQQPTTASVVLRLKPGANMSRPMAAGITSLVARSVEGLRPENVTILDSAGHLISDPRSRDGDAYSAAQLDLRRDLEAHLAAKAEEMLSRHLGPGRALVRVSTELNLQKTKELRESYTVEERVARTETSSSSDSSPTGGDGRGVAGAGSNTGRAGGNNSNGGGGSRSREERTSTDYLIPKTTRLLEGQPGMLQRLTVAVMVDLSPPKEEGENRAMISVKEVEEIVKAAVGFQSGRDEIKVSSVSLAGIAPLTEADAPSWLDQIQVYVHLARNVSLMIAFAFLAATLLVLVRRFKVPSGDATTGGPAPDRNGFGGATGQGPMLDRQQLMELANTDPRQVARMLANLMRANGAPRT